MKKLISLTLSLVAVLLCFSSCSSENNSNYPPKLISSTTTNLLYNNMYFYLEESGELNGATYKTLKYHNLNNKYDESLHVYSDLLSEENDPFTTWGTPYFMIDKEATVKNGGVPVIIYAYIYSEGDTNPDDEMSNYRIISHNMATNKMTEICSSMGPITGTVYLYGDMIYYTRVFVDSESGEVSYVPCIISKQSGTVQAFEYPNKRFICKLLSISENTIYLFEEKTNTIYKTDLLFKSFDTVSDEYTKPFVIGEYLYYTSDGKFEKDGGQFNKYDIYRKELKQLDSTDEETVLMDIGNYLIRDGVIYYSKTDDAIICEMQSGSGFNMAFYKKYYSYDISKNNHEDFCDLTAYREDRIMTVERTSDKFYIFSYISDGEITIKINRVAVNRENGNEIILTK